MLPLVPLVYHSSPNKSSIDLFLLIFAYVNIVRILSLDPDICAH